MRVSRSSEGRSRKVIVSQIGGTTVLWAGPGEQITQIMCDKPQIATHVYPIRSLAEPKGSVNSAFHAQFSASPGAVDTDLEVI